MSHNAKVILYIGVVVGLAVVLWGPKGLLTLLPGPNPR